MTVSPAAFGPDLAAAYVGIVSVLAMGLISAYAEFRRVARDQLVKDHEALRDDVVSQLGACRADLARVTAELADSRRRLAECERRYDALSARLLELVGARPHPAPEATP